jgi:hypothetical protein
MEAGTDVQPIESTAEWTVFAEGIAAVDVRYMTTICVKRTDGELIAEQSKLTTREVEK